MQTENEPVTAITLYRVMSWNSILIIIIIIIIRIIIIIIIIIILFIERHIHRAVRGAVQHSKAALSVIINIQVIFFV